MIGKTEDQQKVDINSFSRLDKKSTIMFYDHFLKIRTGLHNLNQNGSYKLSS